MGVASINPTFAECLETRIKRIILLKFLIGLILWLIVFYQPEIGMLTFVEDGFKSHRHRTAVRQFCKNIVCPGIRIQASSGTLSSGDIPCRAILQIT